MDLSFLIPSKTRRTVLDYFVKNPDAQVGVRELARAVALPPQLIHRELTNLESWGFLFSSKVGMTRAFRRNKKFIFNTAIDEFFNKYHFFKSRRTQVDQVFEWEKLSKEYRKIPIPEDLIPGLTSPRKRPRAFDEEKLLKQKGLL